MIFKCGSWVMVLVGMRTADAISSLSALEVALWQQSVCESCLRVQSHSCMVHERSSGSDTRGKA